MNNKLRIVLALALVIVTVVVPLSVLAYTWEYYTEITITDTSGTSRTGIPVFIPIKGQNLLDAGYINSTGRNTNMAEGASERNFGLYLDNATLLIPSLSADQSRTYRLYTGYSPSVDSHGIIIGSCAVNVSSNVTIQDNATLELGDDFAIIQEGYVDTSSGDDKYLAHKPDAFMTYVSGAGNVSSAFLDATVEWATPASGPANCRDDNTTTYSEDDIFAYQWSDWFTFEHNGSSLCQGARYWVTRESSFVDEHEIQLFYNGSYNTVSTGGIGSIGSWQARYGDTYYLANASRVRFYNGAGTTKWIRLHEYDYQGQGVHVTATNVTSGEHLFETIADGTNFTILVDGVEEDSVVLNNNSMVDNSNNWTILENDVMPYMESLVIFTNSTNWTSPTGHDYVAFGDGYYWEDWSNAYDNNEASYAVEGYPVVTFPLTLILNSSIFSNGVRINASDWMGMDTDANITVALYYNNDWHTIHNGTVANCTWETLTNPDGIQRVSKVRIYSNNLTLRTRVYELDFREYNSMAWYQPTTMISGNTLPDRSGNDNNGTIAWGSNDNLTISIGSTIEFNTTTPAPTETGSVSDTVTAAQEPVGWYANESKLSTLPLYSMFNASATEMEMPTQTLYVFVILGLATAVGLGTVLFTGSPLMAAGITGFIIFAGVSTTMLGGWMIYVFAILAIAILYLARQH